MTGFDGFYIQAHRTFLYCRSWMNLYSTKNIFWIYRSRCEILSIRVTLKMLSGLSHSEIAKTVAPLHSATFHLHKMSKSRIYNNLSVFRVKHFHHNTSFSLPFANVHIWHSNSKNHGVAKNSSYSGAPTAPPERKKPWTINMKASRTLINKSQTCLTTWLRKFLEASRNQWTLWLEMDGCKRRLTIS